MNSKRRNILIGITTLFTCLSLTGLRGQRIVFSEGFNSNFNEPYEFRWGLWFGVSTPGIIEDGNNGTNATEGDSFAALNVNRHGAGSPVFAGMVIDLGTIAEAGLTYTFTGDFSWRFGKVNVAGELRIIGSGQSCFLVDGNPVGTPIPQFYFNMPKMEWKQHSFSYKTATDDVGKSIKLRIRLADDLAYHGLTQLITDNWKVTIIP